MCKGLLRKLLLTGKGSLTFLMISCESDHLARDLTAGDAQVIELDLRLQLLNFRAARATDGSTNDLSNAQSKVAFVEDRLVRLTEQKTAIRAEISKLESQMSAARELVTVERREGVVGVEIERLVVRDGRSFSGVRITSIDDAGVSIRHATGAARLRYEDLTESQHVEFGMDAALASAAEQREHKAAADYEEWLAKEVCLVDKKQAETVVPNGQAFAATGSTPTGRVTSISSVGRLSPLAQPARPFGTGSLYRFARYRSYFPEYRTVRYYQPFFASYPACQGVPRPNQAGALQLPPVPRSGAQKVPALPPCHASVQTP